MKLLEATVFFRGLFLTSPSATNYAADSCRALKLRHFNVTQPSSSSGSWSDLCTADPRAPCNSSRALHWGHTVFSLRIWKSHLLQAHFQTTMEQVQPAEWRQPCATCTGALQRVLHMQPVAGQTKHPAPNKGMWRKSKERRAALKAACAKAALLFIHIRALLNQSDRSLLENI